MSDANDKDHHKLSLSGKHTLQLKKSIEAGQVRQSFSHGRTKAVVVERRRTRPVVKEGGSPEEIRAEEIAAVRPAPPPPAKREVPADHGGAKGRVILKTLTTEEKASRARALEDSRRMSDEKRREAQVHAEARARDEARMKSEHDAAEKRREEEEQRKKTEDVARRKSEEDAARRLSDVKGPETGDKTPLMPAARALPRVEEEDDDKPKRGRGTPAKPTVSRRTDARRRGRLTVVSALEDSEERQRSLASFRRARERERRHAMGAEPPSKVVREVIIPETITVQELANRMAERAVDVIKALMRMDIMATINQTLDADTAELLVGEFGHTAKRVSESDVEIGVKGAEDDPADLKSRPPVVTVMGHVDHGKTSLLDALRETDVAAGEAGGITQHIGAYKVKLPSGQHITFLDTPGHEAFTAMRARGAQVTDLVILVVAADDGIMPQTVEAINHAKAAGVPMIVAINKMDKPGADPARVRNDLLKYEVVCEQMGGDVLNIEVSATKRTNLDKLEEAILLQAEVLELKANPNRAAEGVVIEAKLDRGRGAVATILVQRGMIRVGDIVVAGANWGRARALINDRGVSVSEAGPTDPVEVLGLDGTPDAGDEFAVVPNEARARDITRFRERRQRDARVAFTPVSLEKMFSRISEQKAKELPIVIKADVQGSAEAIVGALEKMSTDEVAVRVLHAAVGGVTESDVTLAAASRAPILAFNVRANKQAKALAHVEGIEVRTYSVIYNLVDDIKAALSGMLSPEVRETSLGEAEVRDIFAVGKTGKAAGCLVTNGVIRRDAMARLLRDNVVVFEGPIGSLRRFKDEVREVQAGVECGISFATYQDVRAGDVIEAFDRQEIARTL